MQTSFFKRLKLFKVSNKQKSFEDSETSAGVMMSFSCEKGSGDGLSLIACMTDCWKRAAG